MPNYSTSGEKIRINGLHPLDRYGIIVAMAQKEKTRNGGLWTEARFTSFVTSALRSACRRWQPKYETLKAACVGIRKNASSGRDAKHYHCSSCKRAYPQKQVQVDHIVPIGKGLDWNTFIEKLFCERDNLQVLCKTCHKRKTKNENKKDN